MNIRARPVVPLLVIALLALGAAALLRPARHAGPILYLHLTLGPYMGPGQPPKDIQYWIDAAGGRVFYAEAFAAPGSLRLSADDRPAQRLGSPRVVISLIQQSNGTCAVTYTTLTERIVAAHMLPPNALPGNFFDPPAFSLPDRAPGVYRWLHDLLPWHP